MPPPDRHDWTREEVSALWARPLLDLVFEAAALHRARHPGGRVKQAALLSVKTGACPEDCGYCPQSAHHEAGVERADLMSVEDVRAEAERAKAQGAARFCMGGAYRSVPDGEAFDRILGMVRAVHALGMESCVTLGMLRPDQARRLREAGLTAYNHNLDTGEAFYDRVVSTRGYRDRLETLRHVREAGLSVCCGGILGLGETDDDRVDLLHTLARFDPHPESVPVNVLVPVEGTPMASRPRVDPLVLVRTIACARLLMPMSHVRLSAGRKDLSDAEQALCFLAGADSVFAGDRLLTTPNVAASRDDDLFRRLGLAAAPPEPSPAARPS